MPLPAPLAPHATHASSSLSEILRQAGVSGAGGAGFPTYPKYEMPLKILVTNAQESEPGYRCDKWLHETYPKDFAALYAYLLDWGVEKVLFGAKLKDRGSFEALEATTDGVFLDCTGKNRHDLDAQEHSVLFAYTDDRYAYGKEGALLLVTASAKIPAGERPNQHGFIVNNSETLFNILRAVRDGVPVTQKLVHVFGETPKHTFVRAPIGTPISVLLDDAGMSLATVEAKGFVLVDGGPGWYEVIADPHTAVVTRRMNSVLVIDPAYRDPSGKDVLAKGPTPGYPKEDGPLVEAAPRDISPGKVVVPLIDNPAFGIVNPAVVCVSVGQTVKPGDVVAQANLQGISIPAHASIAGVVTAVSTQGVEISAAD